MRHEGLIERFIASFKKLDEMAESPEIYPMVRQLAVGSPDSDGRLRWEPLRKRTDPSQLDPLLAKLPARFPPLFEELVLSYRWAEVDLQLFRLLPNPPGPDLSGLLHEMMKAKALWDGLLPAGFIQFGMGPDMDYDPVVSIFDRVQSARTTGSSRSVMKKSCAIIASRWSQSSLRALNG
jgi:hypothetical protein